MKRILAIATLGVALASGAHAATATSSFAVSATVTATCEVISAGALSFGEVGATTEAVDASSDIVVKCTDTTTYDIGLDAGTATGATVTTREMSSPTATTSSLGYGLYSDSGRTTNWGDTVGTDTVAGAGNGGNQTHTVYGRVPMQDAVAPANDYADTITVTVTY